VSDPDERPPTASEPRELAVQALYEADLRHHDHLEDPGRLPLRARGLAEGVLAERAELDAAIEAASEHWRVERMPAVDRAILRLGLYELRRHPELPAAVIVSEAVRIAKEFSTERSGSFVNGVLATLARAERPGE
jgi:transcription antitermination protein NusB